MILIFGGAYQGKLEYAKENYQINEDEVFYCSDFLNLDYDKRVWTGLEKYIWACAKAEKEAKELLDWDGMEGKIIICDDTSQGLVPMDPVEREYREMAGRTLLAISKKSQEVIRVFCGLGQKLK